MLLSLVFCFIPRPAWMVASFDRPQMHLLVCRRLFTVGLQKGAHNGSNCRALMTRLRRCCSPLRPPSRVLDTAAPPQRRVFCAPGRRALASSSLCAPTCAPVPERSVLQADLSFLAPRTSLNFGPPPRPTYSFPPHLLLLSTLVCMVPRVLLVCSSCASRPWSVVSHHPSRFV